MPSTSALYDARAARYDQLVRTLRYAQTRHAVLDQFLPPLPEHPTILDIGCGTGISTDVLREHYRDAAIRGLDDSPEMASIFRKRHPTIPVVLGDFNDLTLTGSHPLLMPGTYDLVVSAGALSEYGQTDAYRLVGRLLKDSGRLLIIGIRRNLIGRLIGEMWKFHPRDPQEIADTCRIAGFNSVHVSSISWRQFPRTLIDIVVLAEKLPGHPVLASQLDVV